MSTDVSSPASPESSAPSKRSPGIMFWLGLVVFLAGIVVVVLGVSAAETSTEREDDLQVYSEASTKARFAASVGADAAFSGQQLVVLNQSDAAGFDELRQLVLDRSTRYNTRKADLNLESVQQAELLDKIRLLDDELTGALAVNGSVEPRPSGP